jgi:hypothetical protein
MRIGRGSYRKSYIVPHGNGFKYLRGVPRDIQHLENRRAWVRCLGNVSRAEAEMLAHALAYVHSKRVLGLRELLTTTPLMRSLGGESAPASLLEPGSAGPPSAARTTAELV